MTISLVAMQIELSTRRSLRRQRPLLRGKCGASAMSSTPRSSSSLRYHEVNKKEVSRIKLSNSRRYIILILKLQFVCLKKTSSVCSIIVKKNCSS